jgi:hypothetical protein
MNALPAFTVPTACAFCGQPFKFSGDSDHVTVWRASTGRLYCSEFCADDEEEANFRRRRA